MLPKFLIQNFSSVLNVLNPLPPTLLVAPKKLNVAEGAKDAIVKIMKGQVFPGGRHSPTPASTAWEVEHGLNLYLSPFHQAPFH